MALQLSLERNNGSTLYQQIAEQIKDRICDGRLPAGTQLPTIRHLAHALSVTRLTVQNAYAELQTNGWIEATVGRGTFVADGVRPRPPLILPGQPITTDGVINDILRGNQISGMRSMSNASPDLRLFPSEEFWHGLESLRSSFVEMTPYVSSQGDSSLLVELANFVQEREIDVLPEEILVTNGATQGFSLVTQALCRPGDRVLVEQPTYLGFLNSIQAQGVQPVGVPLDDEGVRLDALERMIVQERPRFLYTVPSFQNPTGLSLSLERRKELVALAERYNLLVVEDDIYGRLSYDGPPPLPLKALDRTGTVIHIGSFSKMLMPSLRLGFVIAPPPLHQRLVSLRRATDLCGSLFLQRALAEFLHNGGLRRHLRRVLPIYRERRDALLSALKLAMPADVRWTRPTGGLVCWLTLPAQPNMADLLMATQQAGWNFAPGEVFLAQPEAIHHLRLSFGQSPPETIRSGVDTLAKLIKERIAKRQGQKANPVKDWTPLV
ncbi:MAG: PLP-dependent aminotransferase family protein [Caldilineaceae bacterium]